MKFVIYDIECLKNFFSISFKDYTTRKLKFFTICETQNDYKKILQYLKRFKQYGYWMVGFNNISYDGQLVEFLIRRRKELNSLSGLLIAQHLYDLSQKIISLREEERYLNLVPEWKFTVPQLDLLKQRNYDSVNKRTSLKWLEFTMRFPNIQSLPIQHHEEVSANMIPSIKKYNINDVDATLEFFNRIKYETDLRIQLSTEYKLNLMNASEPRLAREIFGKIMSEETGVDYRSMKELRSYRNTIFTKSIIFDYVKFDSVILKGVLDFYKSLTFNPYNFEENNLRLSEVSKTFSYHNIPEVTIGLGGIHGCIHSGVYTATPNWKIEDIDVSSFYPNLSIKNHLYPEHLSLSFCSVYESLYNKRKEIPKTSPVNYIYKIILNSAYGLSKEPNNYFHDPKYTFSITINGQLLILMLAEYILKKVPGCKFYQVNTDGLTVGYHPDYKTKVQEAKDEWMKLTKLELENKFYTKMVIKDVNNYIAVDEKGKVKRKGAAFAYSLDPEDRELEYHKNPSALIIPKALEQYFIYGKSIEESVYGCKDIFDFCLGVKVKKDFDLIEYGISNREFYTRVLHEQVVRYFVSHTNSSLKKKYKYGTKKHGQKATDLQKGWNLTHFNNFNDCNFEDYKIDYRFYLEKIRKIISEIDSNMINAKIEFPNE